MNPPPPRVPLHLQMLFHSHSPSSSNVLSLSLVKWSTWYKEELLATSFQGKFSFNLGSGNNSANLPFRRNVFMLSFNTNLLIPSNASLYITMHNQLYTLNMVQIVIIKIQGKEGRQCLCALFIGKLSKRNNWGRKDKPYILTREKVSGLKPFAGHETTK